MYLNRIQKLLYSESSEFDDVVLVESPFAEITKKGFGIRQVQLGLTASKFIIARDIMKNVDEYEVLFLPGQLDPEIESLKLISVLPIELVSLSVFQRRRRRILKARFHNGDPTLRPKICYFELGGLEKRKMFWNIWCEKVQFLSPSLQYNSISEVSVGSSTSAETISPVYTKCIGDKIWQYYESDSGGMVESHKTALIDTSGDEVKTLFINDGFECSSSCGLTPPISKTQRINRFGEGVDEQCGTDLFLPVDSYLNTSGSKGVHQKYQFKNFEEFLNQCVGLWLKNRAAKNQRSRWFYPSPDLNNGVGVLSTDKAGQFTLQMKRARSLISVTEERLNFSFFSSKLSVNEKTVLESQSADLVLNRSICSSSSNIRYSYFWTTDFWYKPVPFRRKLSQLKKRSPENLKMKLNFFQKTRNKRRDEEKVFKKLHRLLEMSKIISIWSLDSNTLSLQLTTIDVNLFLKISSQELRMAKKQGTARNCKNFMTWLTFSHRISCLVATQILRAQDTKTRARLVSRFIMVCDKCHHLGNHQSTSSILLGMMSPAIYRLYATWDRVRRFHSSAYRVFKYLCQTYKKPTLPDLNKPPYLPCARFFLDILFGRLLPISPALIVQDLESSTLNELKPLCEVETTGASLTKIMQQILSTLKNFSASSSKTSDGAEVLPEPTTGNVSHASVDSSNLFPGLREAENILQLSLIAARKYDLTITNDAQEFLLKQPYLEHSVNFQLSLKVEPPLQN